MSNEATMISSQLTIARGGEALSQATSAGCSRRMSCVNDCA